MINKVTLIGNLGQEAEIKNLESGSMVGRLSVATNESYKDKNGEWQTETQWHRVIVWRNLAERASKFKKGNLVFIEGKLTHRKHESEGGGVRYYTEVVAKTIRLLERKENEGSFPQQESVATTTQVSTNTSVNLADDDLPF